MNLNYLECFLTLSKNLSFTETAKYLSITQPSVSRQIRLLEEQMNCKLFIRDKHRVQLTQEGRTLKTHLAPLLESVNRVLSSSAEKYHEMEGIISFGCIPEMGQHFFMSHLLDFQNLYPKVNLDVRLALDDEVIENVKNGELDFGVTTRPVISESIRSYRLIEERSVLVTRFENKSTLGPLEDSHFVAYNRNDPLLAALLKKHYRFRDFRKVHHLSTVNSHKSIIDTLLKRDCYAALPYFSVQKLVKQKKLKIVSEKEERNLLFLVQTENENLSKKNLVFRKFIIERCRSAGTP